MNLVFCGTPEFAVPTLRKLIVEGFHVELVVTQPDRPSGRGMGLTHSPVKREALKMGLPLAQPDRIKNNQDFRGQLEKIAPRAIVVVGYGRIIPQWMIDLPPLGNINLHASLLPNYRGAAPIQWAIANGESITGVTTMRIDAGLDTGDILLQQEVPISFEDTAITLAPRLAGIGADLMVQTLRGLETGSVSPRPQEHTKATVAPVLKKEDGAADFTLPAPTLANRIRGFQPWPGVFASFRGRNLTLWKAATAAPDESVGLVKREPGELITVRDRVFIACGSYSSLELLEVQPEGKKRMSARDFVHGYRPRAGDKLEKPEIVATPSSRARGS